MVFVIEWRGVGWMDGSKHSPSSPLLVVEAGGHAVTACLSDEFSTTSSAALSSTELPVSPNRMRCLSPFPLGHEGYKHLVRHASFQAPAGISVAFMLANNVRAEFV